MSELYKCYACKASKPAAAFFADRSRPNGIASRCKKCDDAKNALRRERRAEGRREIIRRAKNAPCMDCGVSYPPYVMDFDHRPGVEKRFSISNAMRFSTTEVLAEIDKCDLVCSNCHRQRTHNRGLPVKADDD